MPPLAAAVVVFATSAAVLVLEIIAGRLLAPYVGVTLETYTGIIGTVLAGISLGTWLGGRAADRLDPRRLLGPLLMVGGGLALLVVPLVALVATLGARGGPGAVVLYAAAAFFAPAAVLSAVTPTVVKLQLRDLGRTGRVVGRLSAIGTAGAIFGTFVTGFVLVAALPTRPIVIGLGVALVIAGIVVWATLGGRRRTGLPFAAVALAVVGVPWSAGAPQPCERESAYYCIRVEEDETPPTGRTLHLDGLRHSYVDLADPTHLEFGYIQVLGDLANEVAAPRAPIRALHVGGGGFTMPRFIDATRPGSYSRVLELDPTVLAVAEAELGLQRSPALEVRIGDARQSIAAEASADYDLVIGDAFGGLAVPWHLTTRELAVSVQRVLRPGGIYAINVIDYPPLRFARAELATLGAVFGHVALIAPPDRVTGHGGGNLILVASDSPIPADRIQRRIAGRVDDDVVVADPAGLDRWLGDAAVLTDDHAPVDQLLTVR